MANDFVIRINEAAIAPLVHPRVVTPRYEADHLGVGKVVRRIDPCAALPRIARSFEAPDSQGCK